MEEANRSSSQAELDSLSKEDLISRIQQLESHVFQLRNLLNKSQETKSENKKQSKQQRKFDFSKYNVRHVLLKFAYFGWTYQGYAVQEDTINTIETELFNALLRTRLIDTRQTSNYHRCGRTDKGVSAFSQVISIDLRSNLKEGVGVVVRNPEAKTQSEEINYVNILNHVLPQDIRVLGWTPVETGFSARFDCRCRVYRYFLPRGQLDVDRMRAASAKLVGEKDFRNFCKMDVGNGVVTFVRRIESIEMERVRVSSDSEKEGEDTDPYSFYCIQVKGNAFLWHQIRCIVSVLLMIGRHLESAELIDQLLDVERNPTKPQYSMADEEPLVLFDCDFEGIEWHCGENENTLIAAHLQRMWCRQAVRLTQIRVLLDVVERRPGGDTAKEHIRELSEEGHSKRYRPLMERERASSLESRVDHYVKRRRLDETVYEKMKK